MNRREDDDSDDTNRWLVSYADFITLLFALFVVLYAYSQANEAKHQALSEAIGEAFGRSGGGLLPATGKIVGNEPRPTALDPQAASRIELRRRTMDTVRALIGAADVEALADQVVARGLSVRDTERLARAAKPAPRSHSSDGGGRDPDLAALEHQLADLLGLSVRVTYGAKGGTLVLSYSTLDQLDMVCQRLTGERI
ncbi:MAG: hypothetical protein EBV35_06450 [Betaproteobacteria bacterium]|nr:hypothetical protein [Betaproteobacteria bacterium]